MPRKQNDKILHRLDQDINNYIDSLQSINSHAADNADKICHHYKLELLYAEWLLRAMEKMGAEAETEFSLQLVKDHSGMEKRLKFIIGRLKQGMKKAVILRSESTATQQLCFLGGESIDIDMYASEKEIRVGVNIALTELLFKRAKLKLKEPSRFMKEIKTSKGTDINKIVDGIQRSLEWYDKHKNSTDYEYVAEVYGEQATRDDKEFNRKKSAFYENQRLAENLLRAAITGDFPPTSITQSRAKRPSLMK